MYAPTARLYFNGVKEHIHYMMKQYMDGKKTGIMGVYMIENSSDASGKLGELEMPAEDRRVSGLNLLMLLAEAYYKLLASAVGAPCGALDLDLNNSYLWTLKNIRNLLNNHVDLKDFPLSFDPMFLDLCPSTVRDVDWEYMVAPDAERFLSTVQKYVMDKGIYSPEEYSFAWILIEMFKPSITAAIEAAEAYRKRMDQYFAKMMANVSKRFPSQPTITSPSEQPKYPVAEETQSTDEDKYEWAKQAELVRATNQVLGQGALNPGVLSRAKRDQQIKTNGKSSRSSRVNVSSFLAWIVRKFELAAEEQIQIRNAIIGEINERN